MSKKKHDAAKKVQNNRIKAGLVLWVFAISSIFFGCKQPTDPKKEDPKKCECPEKEHDAACTCEGEDCGCTIKPKDPVVEDPVVEDPVVEDPVVDDPVVDDPVVDDPVVEDPVVEDPVVEDPTCTCAEKDHAEQCNCAAMGYDCDCTVKANPKTYTLHLGDHPITIEDRTWELLQEARDMMQVRLDAHNHAETETAVNVKQRSNVKIVVIEGDGLYEDEKSYRVIDGNTIETHVGFLNDATLGQINALLVNGFNEMLSHPAVARGFF